MKSLKTSTWNTTNWAVTTLANTWYNCRTLITLEISNWNTTNWAVTSLS
jgi:surface protein